MAMATEVTTSTACPTNGLIDDDGKNAFKLTCERCPSVIMQAHVGVHAEHSFDLPLARQTRESAGGVERETVTQYWMVSDQFAFDNAGFTNSVDGTRYLTCADCELGPIGYVDKATDKMFVAVARVKHIPNP